jgi:hypothetical protein
VVNVFSSNPTEFVALNVRVVTTASVGVPVITPVEVIKDRLFGNVPLTKDQVIVESQVADKVAL